MNSKIQSTQTRFKTISLRLSLTLLTALAMLIWVPLAGAQDSWTGAAGAAGTSGLNAWGTAGNWQADAVPAAGDNLDFPASSTYFFSTNNLKGFGIGQLTFDGSGYILTGQPLEITNGITDNAGANSNSIPLTLGASQTFANNSGSGYTNTENGTITLHTNALTIGGSAPVFLNGVISSGTNSGQLIINNSAVTRLSAAGYYGTNYVKITSTFTPVSTDTNTTIYTNSYVVAGVSTNYYYETNTVVTTNGTYAYTTNVVGPLNRDAVWVQAGTLQLNAAGAIPNGANVGNLALDGTLDLNGQSPTVNGLDDSGSYAGIVDNFAGTGLYTLTVGNANSNSVFTGVIGNPTGGATSGSIGLTKTGWGTFTLANANHYGGPTIVHQGILAVASGASLGDHSTALTIDSGAQLQVQGVGGYVPTGPLTIAAGTPTKPYTNYLGSYDPNVSPDYTVFVTGTNNVFTYQTNTDLATYTNVVVTTNVASYTYSTNTIISVINSDVVGDFTVNGGGAISPLTTLSPGIATWKINGNLTMDNSLGLPAPQDKNRINFLLNSTTTPGGGTNDLVAVTGNLTIGDELDFVITPVTGTLAAGTYTLITSSGYTPESGIHAPVLKLVEARGLVGDTVQADGNNITLTSLGGTAIPGDIVWAGTPNTSAWDVDLTQNWLSNGVPDYFYSLDRVTFGDGGVGTISLPTVVNPGTITFDNNLTNYVFAQGTATFITGAQGGLIKNGSGTVTLQNPNTLDGDVSVNDGVLNLGYYDTSTSGQNVLFNGVAAHDLYMGGGTIDQIQQANTPPYTPFENLHVNPGASSIVQQGRAANEFPIYEISNNVTRVVGGVLNVSLTGRGGTKAGLYFDSTNSPDGTADYGVNGIVGGWATYNLSDWLYANNASTTARGGNMAYFGYQSDNNPANWGANSNVEVSSSVSGINTTTINSLKLSTASTLGLSLNSGQTLTLASGGLLVPTSSGPRQDSINGGTLMGAAGQDLVVLNNNTILGSSLTIGSVIADNGGATGLTTGGGGRTILTGNNTYTGPTIINRGFTPATGYAGTTTGTLQVGANGTSGDISHSSAVIDNGTLAFNRSDNVNISGVISGTGNLTKLGGGVLTLTANNTLSGLVTVTSGTLQLGNGGSSGSVSNTVAIVNNGRLVFNNDSTVSYPNPISGYGNVVQAGTGDLVIPTAETYSGNTVVSNGTMTLTASASIPNTAAIVVKAGAVLDASAVSGGLTLRSGTPSEVLAGSGTINGSVTTADGSTLAPGTNGVAGTLTINDNLNLSGGLFMFDVTNNANALGDLVNVGGTLALNSGTVLIHVTGTPLAIGAYPLIHATGGITGASANLGLAGFAQAGQSAQLIVQNNYLYLLVSGNPVTTLTWVGDNSQNIWNINGAANWTTGLGATTYGNPDYVTISDTGSANPPIDIAVSVSPTAVTNSSSANNYVLGKSTGSAGKITGGAQLVKTGTGLLTLQTVNDYLGGTFINAGTIQLGDNTAATEDGMVGGNGPVVIAAGASLVASNAGPETLSGGLSGSGSLAQQGAGKLVLAGDNSAFTGAIYSTNFLQMGDGFSGTLGTGPVTSDGTLFLNVGPTPATAVAVDANIAGLGGITNLGPGIATLSGSNSFAGNLANDTGTIQLGSDAALPGGVGVYMDDSAGGSTGTLDLNDHDAAVSILTGAATGIGTSTFVPAKVLNNGSGTATLTINGGGTLTFNGQLLDNNNGGVGKLALVVNNDTTLTLASGYNSSGIGSPNLFSGGLTISNASVFIGNAGQRTDLQQGAESAGLGTITLEGGLGAITNENTGFPTNGMLYAPMATGNPNSANSEYITIPTINVPAGQIGTMFGPKYGEIDFPLTGSGIFTYQPSYVRDRVGGDWSAFTGTIIFQVRPTSNGNDGGGFVISGPNGFPNANLFMQLSNIVQVQISGTVSGNVFPIGALSGGDSTSLLGGGTSANGTKNNARPTTWAIGSLGLSTTNGSEFTDSGCGVRVVGGSLTLTNNVLSFGGQLVVSNSTLALAPLGTNADGSPINYLTNTTYLVCTPIAIVGSGALDLSQVGDNTLHLGHNAAQSLYGNGTIKGNLVSANSEIAPGLRVGDNGTYPGQLAVTGSAEIDTGSTFQMAVSPSGYDSVTAGGGLTINDAALVVVTNGPAFAPGSSNVFRFFSSAVPVGSSGITNITVPDVPNSYWVTNLTLDGSMALVNTSTGPSINPNPGPVQVSISGNTLTLGWPTNLGWILQSQTNDTTVGLSNNWVDVTGSDTRTNEVFTIDPSSPSVFFRLRHP